MKRAGWILLAGVLAALASPQALACTACFGQSDSQMAKGMNMGIFTLLLIITSVLCGVSGFFVYLARRSHQLEQAAQQAQYAASAKKV